MNVSQIQEPIKNEIDNHYLNMEIGKAVYNIVGKHGISKTASIFNDSLIKKSTLLSTMTLFYNLHDKEVVEKNNKILSGEFANSNMPSNISYSQLEKNIPVLKEFLDKMLPYQTDFPYVYNSVLFLYELIKNRCYTFSYLPITNEDRALYKKQIAETGQSDFSFYFSKKVVKDYLLASQNKIMMLSLSHVLSLLDSLNSIVGNEIKIEKKLIEKLTELNESLEKTISSKLLNSDYLDYYKQHVIRIFSVAGLRATDFGYQYISEGTTLTSNSFNVPNTENITNGIYPMFGLFVLDDGFINPEILSIYYGLFDEKNPTIAGKPVCKTIIPVILSNEAFDRVVMRTKMNMSGAHNTRIITLHVDPDIKYNIDYLLKKEIDPIVDKILSILEVKMQNDEKRIKEIKEQISDFNKIIKSSRSLDLYNKLLHNSVDDELTFDSFDARVLKQLLVHTIYKGYFTHVIQNNSSSIQNFKPFLMKTIKIQLSAFDKTLENNPKKELFKFYEQEIKSINDMNMVEDKMLININSLLELDDVAFENKLKEIEKQKYTIRTNLINSFVSYFNSGEYISEVEAVKLHKLMANLTNDDFKNIQTRLNKEGKMLYSYVVDLNNQKDPILGTNF